MKESMKNLALFSTFALAAMVPAYAELPDGAGKPIIQRACDGCHRADAMVDYHKTPDEWDTIVRRMIGRGAQVTGADVDTVIQYLTKSFPKIEDASKLNVNKATVEQLVSVMGLTPEEAKAVVDYRDRHGSYRVWGEMLVIYGVDGRKIQAAKDKISY
jgi:DNA uptake protein ComE-like DNA-binding protein